MINKICDQFGMVGRPGICGPIVTVELGGQDPAAGISRPGLGIFLENEQTQYGGKAWL